MIIYKKFLPYLHENLAKAITKTPLLNAENLATELGIDNVFLKLDSVLPYSHTFKDRGAVTAISNILKTGKNKLMCASCGNMSSAMSPVAAKANIDCYVLLSAEANNANKLSMEFSGAKILEFNGRFDEVDDIIAEFSKKYPEIPCINTNLTEIYMQGLKTLYFEIFDDLSKTFEEINIIVPTADGTLMKAMYLAYIDYKKEYKEINFKPRFILVQPNKCSPIIKAYNTKSEISEWNNKIKTSVLSLSVNYPKLNGSDALNAVINTNGVAIEVEENKVDKFCKLLARTEGIFTDDVGGVVIGALKELKNKNLLNNLPTVCLITGNGLKTVDKFYKQQKSTSSKEDVFNFLNELI